MHARFSDYAGQRNSSGNVLALGAAAIVIIGLLGVFCLNLLQSFTRVGEAKTSIEAAALTASRAMQSLVIVDPNFGLVGLSDSPPPGNDPNQRPVLGYNTIVGTIRLDMLIASRLGNKAMIALAKDDLKLA